MKKILCVLLIIMMSTTACGNKQVDTTSSNGQEVTQNKNTGDNVDSNNDKKENDEKENEVNDLKTFKEVFNGDLEVAADYFNQNIELFNKDQKAEFALEIVKELDNISNSFKDDKGYIGEKIEFAFAPMYPTFSDDLYDCYSFSTNKFNLNCFDESLKNEFIRLRDNKFFTLGVSIYATEGYLDMPYFELCFDKEGYKKLKNAIKIANENKDEDDLDSYMPEYPAYIEFDTVEKAMEDTTMKYTTVMLDNFSQAEQFKDQETWKMMLLIPVDFVEESVKKDSVYYQEDLVSGAKVSDKFMLVSDFDYKTNGHATTYNFSLACNDYVNGALIYNKEWDNYEVRIEEPIFDKNIIVNNPLFENGEEIEIMREGVTLPINLDRSEIHEDLALYLKISKQNYIEGSFKIDLFTFSENEVESYCNFLVSDFTPTEAELIRIEQEIIENSLNESNKNLSRFDNETLFSVDVKKDIDYTNSHLVIIPEQNSINANKLKERTINLTETNKEFPLKFSILGEVMSLEFTYNENPLNEEKKPIVTNVEGPFKDEIIHVNAYLPTDFSYVGVKATYMINSSIESVEFGLDDARDPESHELLIVEAKNYNSEY